MDIKAKKEASEKNLKEARKQYEPLQAELDRIAKVCASVQQQKQRIVSYYLRVFG